MSRHCMIHHASIHKPIKQHHFLSLNLGKYKLTIFENIARDSYSGLVAVFSCIHVFYFSTPKIPLEYILDLSKMRSIPHDKNGYSNETLFKLNGS